MLKFLTVWVTTNYGKFFKRWVYQTILPASWESCMQVKKQQLEPNVEHWTGSKLGKEYIKAVCCHPAYLTYMQRTKCEMPVWMRLKLELTLPGEMPVTSDYADDTTLMAETENKLKSLYEGERGEWKIWLKTQHLRNKDHGIQSHHLMGNRWGNNGNSDRLYFLVLQNHCGRWLQPWN